MNSTNDTWDALGGMQEEEFPHVLTRLFTIYEERLRRNPEDEAATLFFHHLAQAISQTSECNLNRR